MKHKSMSQMNKEKKRKPMTVEEEYRNADVPMPKKKKEDVDDIEFREHLKKFFKG